MRQRLNALTASLWTPFVLTAGLAVLIYGPPALVSSLEPTAVGMMVNLVIVVGLFIFVGNSGVISFGHVSFMALGAYTSALLTISPQSKSAFLPNLPGFLAHAHFGTVPGILLAGVVAGAFGLLVGLVLMRLVGIAAGIATFAVLVIVNTVASNWTDMTGAENPLIGIPASTTRWLALVTCAVVMVCASLFADSSAGLRLRASREDEVAAKALGVNVWRERVVAFTLSGMCVGVGGALYSGFIGSFNASGFYIDTTILTLAMLVVGGVRSLTGAWVGTVAITVITEFLRRLTDGMNFGPLYIQAPSGTEQVGLGVCMLAILLLRQSGLTGGRDVARPDQIRRWIVGLLRRSDGTNFAPLAEQDAVLAENPVAAPAPEETTES
jgi:branched-chain amino acid transport system permease protein